MATLRNTVINETSSTYIPSGTTAARPGSPATGNTRYNTTISMLEFYDGTNWRPVTGYSVGTIGSGGTIAYNANGGGITHSFTATGASTFTPSFTGNISVLVVAGGGGGAGSHGGGGGAGGLVYNYSFPVSSGTPYPISIGAGGAGSPYGAMGGTGGNTNFSTITANGGGGGGYWDIGSNFAGSGGSGGGGGSSGIDSSRYRAWGGSGISGQGFPGGSGVRYNRQSDNAHASGGGGGAGGPGKESADQSYEGITPDGGPGRATDILGTVLYFAGGGGAGPHYSPGGGGSGGVGGGGGGGAHHGSPQMPGDFPRLRGLGGGQALNAGQPAPGQTQGGNAGTNTGGGGGGGNSGGASNQAGGPGIVIIRY